MMTRQLGTVFRPQLPPERLRSVVETADEAGLDQLWLWEDCFLESGIATAVAALAWSQRLTVGIGVLPVPLRNVAVTAMEVATIDRLFPGRFQVGVGHGVQDWMRQVGAKAASPLTLLTEHLQALRALLAGQRVSVQGRYVKLDDVALDWPPLVTPKVFAAGQGHKTLSLSGEFSDGTVLTSGTTPDQVRQAVELINRGRSIGGRTDNHHLAVYVICTTGADATPRLAAEKKRWKLAPESVIGVAGDAAQVAAGIDAWFEAGADSVILQPTIDEPDQEGFVRFVAEQVKPMLI